MHILAIALGGCVRGTPRYGITEDTGGHITYLLGAMGALSKRGDVTRAEIVTRLFDDPGLGEIHSVRHETIGPKLDITRIDSGNRSYLAKERLAADIPAFTRALIAELSARDRLPDVIHAHFSDAAEIAESVRDALDIPFIYTAHSLGIDKRETADHECPGLEQRIAQEDRAIRQANAIIGSSRDECERQLLAYPSADETRIHRIRPGIDHTPASLQDIASARALIAPFLREPDKPIVLAIARPVRKKNLASLIHAFAGSQALQDKANLVILPGLRHSLEQGEDEQVEVLRELVDLIDAHDLHGKVAYPRQHEPADVRGLYALTRETGGVFANPAYIEPFGLTILEAAVHGTPVVATDRGGPPDIIDEIGHGRLCDPTRPRSIGAAIQKLLGDTRAWHHASRNALDNIGRVSWSDYADNFNTVARSLMRPTVHQLARCKPNYLMVCDIDNTLTGCRRSAARLSRFLKGRGDIAFGVATGRSLIEARRIMRQWNLPEPQVWITSVGSEIYWQRGRALELDWSFASKISAGWNAPAIRKLFESHEHLAPQAVTDQRTFKVSYFLDNTAKLPAIGQAIERSGNAARVVFSHDRLLDILPAKAGKHAAVEHVAGAMGIAMDRVMVAGDSGNDIDMLEGCPNAILVANREDGIGQLAQRASVYQARRSHAGGVLEGMLVHLRAMNTQLGEAA